MPGLRDRINARAKLQTGPSSPQRFGSTRLKETIALDIVLVGAELKHPLALVLRYHPVDHDLVVQFVNESERCVPVETEHRCAGPDGGDRRNPNGSARVS